MPTKTEVLRVRLVADGAGKVRADILGVDDSFKRLEKSSTSLGTRIRNLGALFGTLSVAAFGTAVKGAIAFADGIDKAAERAGFGVERFQELRFAAQQVGVTTQQLDDGLRRFSRRIGEAFREGGAFAKQYEKLGVSIQDANGDLRDSEAIFADVVKQFETLETQAEKSAVAARLFGDDAGPQLALLIGQGTDSLNDLTQAARDSGTVLSRETIDKSVEAADALAAMSASVKGLTTSLLNQLAPALTFVSEHIVELTTEFNRFFENRALAADVDIFTGEVERIKALTKEYDALTQKTIDLNNEMRRGVSDARQLEINRQLQATRDRMVEVQAEIKKIKDGIRGAAEETEDLAKAAAKVPPIIPPDTPETTKKTANELQKIINRLNPLQALVTVWDRERQLIEASNIPLKEKIELLKQLDQEFAEATGGPRELADATKKAGDEIKDVTKETTSEVGKLFDRAAENIQREFANTFTDIFRNGELRFETFTDAIRDMFARLAGEIAAMLVFRPQLLSTGLSGVTGGLGLFGAQGAAAGTGTTASAGGLGALLAGGGGSPLLLAGIGIGSGLAGTIAGNAFSNAIGLNASRAGNVGGLLGGLGGAYGGLLLGSSTALGPWGIPLGIALGAFGGSVLGNLFGGGGNNKQRIGIVNLGAGNAGAAAESVFGGIGITREQNIDADAIVRQLAQIDDTLAQLLSPEQIARVQQALPGATQFFSANQFDNEAFDIVRVRLGRIVDAVAGNEIASQLLDRIPRGAENVDELVQEAGRILGLISLFQDESGDLSQAEQALQALNAQFDDLASAADDLGFSLEQVERRRQQELAALVADFDQSIRDQILAITDPLTLALEQQARLAQERLENARTLGADLVEVERLNALERQRILDQFSNLQPLQNAFDAANDSLQDFLDSLDIGEIGGLPVATRAANARQQFNELFAQARTDSAARTELAQFLPTLVELQRQTLGSSPAFFEFQNFLRTSLGNLMDQGDTVATLNDIGDAITRGDNAIVDTLREEVGQLRGAVVDLNADIALLLNAPQAA